MTCIDKESYTWTIKQGQANTLKLTLKNEGEADPWLDLTGYDAKLQIREDPDSVDVEVELLSTAGGITLDPIEGEIIATLTLAQSNDLSDTNRLIQGWVFGVAVFNPSDPESTTLVVIDGSVIVNPSVVR